MQWSEHPLETEVWFERIEMIRNRELPSTEHALRHALHLLQLTPSEFRPAKYPAIDEATYEAFLDSGDLDQAARRLVSAPTLSVTASSAGDRVRVGIQCSILNRTFFGEGSTVADAILQVWSSYFLMLREEGGEGWLKTSEQT